MSEPIAAAEKRGPSSWLLVATGLCVVAVGWAVFDADRTRNPTKPSAPVVASATEPSPPVDARATIRVQDEAPPSLEIPPVAAETKTTFAHPARVLTSQRLEQDGVAEASPPVAEVRLVSAPREAVLIGGARKPDVPAEWATLAGDVPFVFGYEKGLAAAKASGKPPMFFFAAPWCAVCKKVGLETFVDKDVVKALAKFTPVLVDAVSEKAATTKYSVVGIPLVVFEDGKGAEIAKVLGGRSKADFLAIAKDAASKLVAAAPK